MRGDLVRVRKINLIVPSARRARSTRRVAPPLVSLWRLKLRRLAVLLTVLMLWRSRRCSRRRRSARIDVPRLLHIFYSVVVVGSLLLLRPPLLLSWWMWLPLLPLFLLFRVLIDSLSICCVRVRRPASEDSVRLDQALPGEENSHLPSLFLP